jgi:ABC-type lipoprotein export system ATPase subunit
MVFADEPTGNLYSTQSKEIMEIFLRLNSEGVTIVQVTHSEANAAYSQRIIKWRTVGSFPLRKSREGAAGLYGLLVAKPLAL